MVPADHERVPAREPHPPRLQHAHALVVRAGARGGGGRARFLGIYVVSAIAGAAGALLLSGQFVNTVGASGAASILGAGLVLERRRIYVFGGGALFVVVLNIAFTFAVSNISIGGHLGGLIGGILAMLALSAAGRHLIHGRFDVASFLALVATAAGSVFPAY